jgi:hypothetical protein
VTATVRAARGGPRIALAPAGMGTYHSSLQKRAPNLCCGGATQHSTRAMAMLLPQL